MSDTRAVVLIAVSATILYGLWLLLRFTCRQIDDYHTAWHEARQREDAQAAKGMGN